ncbi:MAG TPA: hypothetical protein PLJ35_13525 [Anaerolineae bacterium]|nr:hypothetical protein [Anaerolineae bacterium]HOQ99835.1 hypothetical protein [Anaerolineae bacterium]
MVEQTIAPISHVDMDRLYVDNWTPESWLDLEVRTIELLEDGQLSTDQTRTVVYALREMQRQGEDVPRDASQLYLRVRPILERLPGGYG